MDWKKVGKTAFIASVAASIWGLIVARITEKMIVDSFEKLERSHRNRSGMKLRIDLVPFLVHHGPATVGAIACGIDAKKENVQALLEEMEEKGHVSRVESLNRELWEIFPAFTPEAREQGEVFDEQSSSKDNSNNGRPPLSVVD